MSAPKSRPSVPLSLVALTQPSSPAAEAYRTLRTNLRFAAPGRELRTVLFASPDRTAGKSLALANLGVVAAQGGARVGLLDCNLRQPLLHELFGLPRDPGLTDALLAQAGGGASAVPRQATNVIGLTLLSSGKVAPNPADLLAGAPFEHLLATLREQFDLLLVDGPPVGPLADTLVLATRVDGVLLVLDAHDTHRTQAQQAKARLERVGAHLLGVVLTNSGGYSNGGS